MKPSDTRSAQLSPSEGEPSSITLDAVAAAVVAVFVAGIAAAFIYAKHSNDVQHAAMPLPPPAIYHKVETTGSGG